MIQGTEEWHQARLGKVTASRIADVVAKTKSGWGASRANYAAELIAERLTGKPTEGFISAAMQWGTDTEPQPRIAYEAWTDCPVVETGFVPHPRLEMSGASPDGLIGNDGLVEIKCPNTATHIDTLMGKPISGKYLTQIQWQLACTNREWCDWVSYDPRLPEEMRLFVKRVQRDDALIAILEKEVAAFLTEIGETVEALKQRYAQRAAA